MIVSNLRLEFQHHHIPPFFILLFAFRPNPALAQFHIHHPPNFSPVPLAEGGALTILFAYTPSPTSRDGLSIKIDVMGFADPAGWPQTTLSLTRDPDPGGAGRVRGSAVVAGLVPGAARIRVRLLTPDGTDAVGDAALDLFLDPARCCCFASRGDAAVQACPGGGPSADGGGVRAAAGQSWAGRHAGRPARQAGHGSAHRRQSSGRR